MEEKVGAIHLGDHSTATVFQAETTAVLAGSASFLLETETSNSDIILFDSQAILLATTIRTKSIQETAAVLDSLGKNNRLFLHWIPAHSDYEGNEKADSLAKMGSLNDDAIVVNLPVPQATWKFHTHQLVTNQAEERWKSSETTHIKNTWRDKYTRDLAKLCRSDLATQLLTRHAAVNNHLHKYKPKTISRTCPFCKEEDETITHFVGKCPKWVKERGLYFNTFYASLSEIQDNFSITKLVNLANATGRLDPNLAISNFPRKRPQTRIRDSASGPAGLPARIPRNCRSLNLLLPEPCAGRARDTTSYLTYSMYSPLERILGS